MKFLVVGLINFYQMFLSFDTGILRVFAPGGACKHYPTCSEYTKIQVLQFGVLKGLMLGFRRVVTCL